MSKKQKKARPVGQYLMEASEMYSDDNRIEWHFDFENGKEKPRSMHGNADTLALFVGREIQSVYSEKSTDKQNRAEIARAMGKAAAELNRVADHFARTV